MSQGFRRFLSPEDSVAGLIQRLDLGCCLPQTLAFFQRLSITFCGRLDFFFARERSRSRSVD
jgi:hypothetical protein